MRPELEEIVEDFASVPGEMRLQMLLEFANGLPELPEHLAGRTDLMEQVHECQTPFFVLTEPEGDGTVALWFDAPPEAPTTRGYAGVISAGLSGGTPDEILATPTDLFQKMGLAEVISPLRLRGMGAILARVKRLVSESADGGADQSGAGSPPESGSNPTTSSP